MEDSATLVIILDSRPVYEAIHIIITPNVSIEVDMLNHQTTARNVLIPILCNLLTVLQQIILVVIFVVVDNIRIAILILLRLHITNTGGLFEFFGSNPSSIHLLVYRVVGRGEAVVIVVTAIHQVERAHAIVSTLGSIVEVGQAKAVRELMAERADTTKG